MLGSIVYLHSYLNRTFGKQTVSVSGDPDQMPRFVASDLDLFAYVPQKRRYADMGKCVLEASQGESVLP